MHRTYRAVLNILGPGIIAFGLLSCGTDRHEESASSTHYTTPAPAPTPELAPDYDQAPTDSHDGTGYGYAPAPDASGERYGNIHEGDFFSARNNPLSTFAIDVDRASYSNVRRFIDDGRTPPADAVRIEELINYFTYDYPAPGTGDPISVVTEVGSCPWSPGHRLVSVGLKAVSSDAGRRSASNLVFLIDVSGSMAGDDKLPLLKSGLSTLVGTLGANDRVAIVTYSGAARLALPSTSGADKGRILMAINELDASGATAGEAGIDMAYAIARRNFVAGGNNRVILATDGDFNVGASSTGALSSLIAEKRGGGIFLTVLGLGKGNLNDEGMEALADKGNGSYYYIDGLAEARNVLRDEITATLNTVAKDVKVQVEFNPAVVSSYRLVGYENRALAAREFNDDAVDAGEMGAGQSVMALYEVVPATGGTGGRPEVDPLKYQPSASHETGIGGPMELLTVKIRYKRPDGDISSVIVRPVTDNGYDLSTGNLPFAAAVAEWGMLLRGSKYGGNTSLSEVLRLANAGRGSDPGGHRAEFIALVQRSASVLRLPV